MGLDLKYEPIVSPEKERFGHDGDCPSVDDGPLSSCRVATCWRGALDVFKIF